VKSVMRAAASSETTAVTCRPTSPKLAATSPLIMGEDGRHKGQMLRVAEMPPIDDAGASYSWEWGLG
jgi:hypothetical protein